jgi:hypothetical protein
MLVMDCAESFRNEPLEPGPDYFAPAVAEDLFGALVEDRDALIRSTEMIASAAMETIPGELGQAQRLIDALRCEISSIWRCSSGAPFAHAAPMCA